MEAVELLKQNLAIEPDLQLFVGFILETVSRLGGNCFAASVATLDLIEKLRRSGAGSGRPMSVSLRLRGQQLLAHWDEREAGLARLPELPSAAEVTKLSLHLQNSTASTDPDILLQRNAEMTRHFAETRARAETELEELQLALRMRQAELTEILHQAETDPLTGLLNRRAFDERLQRAFRHTMRQKSSPLSLLLLDLDHFKEINDEFGHQFGDMHLKKMAEILRKVIRVDVDFAFRFGGDEFALVIFADYPLACDKSRQILKMMENKVSIGLTSITPDTEDSLTLEEFIHRADTALYEAKRRGRGRAVVDLCASHDNGNCVFPCPKLGAANG